MAFLLVFSLSSAAFAQQVADPSSAASAQATKKKKEDAEVIQLTKVVVTGSNIKRLDMEKLAPVTVIDQDAMNARNAFTPVELLTSLPGVTNLPENESRLGSSGARGDNANINLRNLGAVSTLILIDGRRMAVNPFTAGLSQAVNINQLPTQAIERVEVLRDGASAIYGSDAVGGVINYVMRRDFKGAELKLRYGDPEGTGGQYAQTSFMVGTPFAGGRGRIMASAEYLYREAIFLRDRDFAASANHTDRAPAPFDALGSAFDGRSARGIFPTFRVGSSTKTNFFRPVNGALALTTVAPTRAANPEFFLDLNQFGMAAPRTRRLNSLATVEYDLSDRVTAFADFSYYKSNSTMVRQPLALNAPTSDQLAVLAVGNPFNPFGARFFSPTGAPNADGTPRLPGTPQTVSLTQGTLPGVAVEKVKTRSNVFRLTAGLKGKLGDSWAWEVAGFYNRDKGVDNANPDVRESLLQAALARTDQTAYNPFGSTFKVQGGAVVADQPFANSESVVASITDVFSRRARSFLASVNARATGRLFTLWSGDIMAALGGEYRREDLEDVRPPFSGENPASSGLDPLNNDFLLHPPRPDVFGDRNVTSFYGEVVVPLVAPQNHVPLINTLEVTGSVRREHYSDFGNTTRPKFGVNWRPIPQVMFRASVNKGFIAPSLAALFTSPRWTISAGAGDIDRYRTPVTNEGPAVQRAFFGGSPDLQATKSTGKTAGVVLDVPGIKGLSLSADYWQISRRDLLGTRTADQIFTSDTALLQDFVQEQLAKGTPVTAIDLGSGTANYKGDPAIVRAAPTAEDLATFAAYNAAHPTNPQPVAGKIVSRNAPFINFGRAYDEGWDLGLNYVLPTLPIGNLTLTSDWAYLTESSLTLLPANAAAVVTDNVGASGAARWKGTTTLTWRKGGWSGSLGAYYTDGTEDTGATTTAAVYEALGRPAYLSKHFTEGRFVYRYVVASTLTYNASLAYHFGDAARGGLRNTTVRVGVINLTDKAPPLASGAFGYDPGATTGNLVVGRAWTLELTKAF